VIWGVVQFPGSCDERDALAAAGLVGEARMLWHADDDLDGVDAVVVPGGFSYGDYLRAGALARFSRLMEALAEFAQQGGPVLGICNGFQVLCEAGLLPGALLTNEDIRFVCRQVEVVVESNRSPFTAGLEPGERLSIPVKHQQGRFFAPDDMLDDIVTMTAAINDAPLDALDVEDEVFSPERIRAFERGQQERGRRTYRVVARHRTTGELAGHTMAAVEQEHPGFGSQYDTSVVRAHRGHRLGLLLKIEMLRWLGDAEPQLRVLDTWNAATNKYMIAVNEQLGHHVIDEGLEWQKHL